MALNLLIVRELSAPYASITFPSCHGRTAHDSQGVTGIFDMVVRRSLLLSMVDNTYSVVKVEDEKRCAT
jgi:hypothetical protein